MTRSEIREQSRKSRALLLEIKLNTLEYSNEDLQKVCDFIINFSLEKSKKRLKELYNIN